MPNRVKAKPKRKAAPKKKAPAAKKKAAVKKVPRGTLDAMERQDILLWLALTDNISETARRSGRDKQTVWLIAQKSKDEIMMLRASLAVDVKGDFVASVRMGQERLRDYIAAMPKGTHLSEIASAMKTLSAIIVEQANIVQTIAQAPVDPDRQPRTAEELEEQAERDMAYLENLIERLRDKGSL